jgi:hypothetical protein
MSTNQCVCGIVLALMASVGTARAASPQPRNAWLTKNYRFTGPPPPRMIKAPEAAVSDMRQVQNTVLSIMRKADFVEDYGTALDAATVAAANAQLIQAMSERPGPVNNAIGDIMDSNSAIPPVACNGRTAEAATWSDGLMQHYVTPQGTHVQVRLKAK